jgi:hypothetical protein
MHWLFVVVGTAVSGLLAYGLLTRRKRPSEDPQSLPGFKVREGWVPLMLMPSSELNVRYPIKPALQSAIDFWNEAAGFRLFEGIGELNLKGRLISLMMDYEQYTKDGVSTAHEDAAAFTVLHFDQNGYVKDAAIYVVVLPDRSPLPLKRALAHELGHCLGLDHDKSSLSVMYGKLTQEVFCVTEKDKQYLKDTFGGQDAASS